MKGTTTHGEPGDVLVTQEEAAAMIELWSRREAMESSAWLSLRDVGETLNISRKGGAEFARASAPPATGVSRSWSTIDTFRHIALHGLIALSVMAALLFAVVMAWSIRAGYYTPPPFPLLAVFCGVWAAGWLLYYRRPVQRALRTVGSIVRTLARSITR